MNGAKLPHSHVRSNWSINFKQKFLIISHPTCSAERISPNRRIYSLYHCLFTRGRINAFCDYSVFRTLISSVTNKNIASRSRTRLLENLHIICYNMKCNKAASAKIVFGFFNTAFFVSITFYLAFIYRYFGVAKKVLYWPWGQGPFAVASW